MTETWNANPHYSPEKCGLELLLTHDYSDGNYCFDYRCVWRDLKTKKLYTARDSGCSCPSPFEDYHRLSDLQEFNLESIEREAKEAAASSYYHGDPIPDFLQKLRNLK